MSVPSGGRRPRGRRVNNVEAAVGSAEQAAQNQAETIQPRLVAAVTEHVQQALREERRNEEEKNEETPTEERGRSRQRGRKRKRDSVRSVSSGTSSGESESGLDSSDSSDSDEVDSDDEQQLLSTPIAAQINVKIKNKIWQNIEFEKLLPKEELGFENMSVHLQTQGIRVQIGYSQKTRTA